MCNLIDREQVIETLKTAPLHITGIHLRKAVLTQYGEKFREGLIDAVRTVSPAQDVEYIRHGYWINVGKTESGSTILECSCCGKERKNGGKSKYCRDCGAKMDAIDLDGGFLI